VRFGPRDVVGMEGVVRDNDYVFVRGELWRAESDTPLLAGERVRVAGLRGLTLDVRRIDT
jgi:membrane protein implicated in regulation of membrane protease activity